MAVRGRPPKPIEAKRRAGNPGKRALPAPAAALPAANGVPKAPIGLQEPGERLWEQVWTHGQAWLTPAFDFGTVEAAARLLDECAAYRSDLDRHGGLLEEPVTTSTGQVVGSRLVPNPAERMLRRAEKQLERWLTELALTPTARARLGLAQVKTQSKLEALIEARGRRAEAGPG